METGKSAPHPLPDIGFLLAGEALALVELAVAAPAAAGEEAIVCLDAAALAVAGLVAMARLARAALAHPVDLQGAVELVGEVQQGAVAVVASHQANFLPERAGYTIGTSALGVHGCVKV